MSGNVVNYNINRLSDSEPFKFRISKVKDTSTEGYRLMDLGMLQKHLSDISLHMAICDKAKDLAVQNRNPVVIQQETRTFGLASELLVKCNGCGHKFQMHTSPQLKTGKKKHFDVNVRAVWGSMVTGSGSHNLNEFMATLNSPSMTRKTFTKIEIEIGDMWQKGVMEDLIEAGMEERRIAIEKGSFSDGVPAISVVCDGGWSKRTHKHSYNAMGGVAIIIGVETGKILHIGIRNKYCAICSHYNSSNNPVPAHICYKNWSASSQSMESDIILDGFLKAESVHGLRYTRVIADGDSSMFTKLQQCVPVWGKDIQKIECANHMCKCLRSNLEKLVDSNPLYKGKNNLPKSIRIRLVSAVRCAIRMRTNETNKALATRKLQHDIKNSIHHVFGNHSKCSTDFCKKREDLINLEKGDNNRPEEESLISEIVSETTDIWEETTSLDLQEEARYQYSCSYDLESYILNDVSVLLDRISQKSNRLIGNFTTNLAESWMAIRCKFDRGKIINRCNRGSWHARCYGSSLRKNFGSAWSPTVWKKCTLTTSGYYFDKLYEQRSREHQASKVCKAKEQSKTRRWKRKMEMHKESTSKRARMDYGPDALDSLPDMTTPELDEKKQTFLKQHINISEDKLRKIELLTKQQSLSPVWLDERRKRLTSSNFGKIFKRNPNLKIQKLIKALLYNNFKGNKHTHIGLRDEAITIKEYTIKKLEENKEVKVERTGLHISRCDKFLAASPDGKVFERNVMGEDGMHNWNIGLLEVKNLLHNKPLSLFEAAKSLKSFCLELHGSSLRLKRSHEYYFQVQGQLNVTKLPWTDFVVRTVNPHQLHIERIYIDEELWKCMLPKLASFYEKALLPELCSPRNHTITGIREPGVWYEDTKQVKNSLKGKTRQNTVDAHIPATAVDSPSHNHRSSRHDLEDKDYDKPTTSATAVNSLSSKQQSSRSKRQSRVKFLGRRIAHEWIENESTNSRKWYKGEVVSLLNGKDGDDSAVYEVIYDGEDEPYEIDSLVEDYKASSVRFIDI